MPFQMIPSTPTNQCYSRQNELPPSCHCSVTSHHLRPQALTSTQPLSLNFGFFALKIHFQGQWCGTATSYPFDTFHVFEKYLNDYSHAGVLAGARSKVHKSMHILQETEYRGTKIILQEASLFPAGPALGV